MAARFVLRLDDITATMHWSRMDYLQSHLDSLGVSAMIGVVPQCEDPTLDVDAARVDFWDWVRDRRSAGWTVAQHGFRHVYDRADGGILRKRPKSEFAGWDYRTQSERLSAGKAILQEQQVWQPVFMAPGHTFDETTVVALADLGFTTITDGYGLYPFTLGGLRCVPQLTMRPIDAGFGVWTLCIHLNTMPEYAFQRLARFVQGHAESFIDVQTAAQMTAPRWVPEGALQAATRVGQAGLVAMRNRLPR